MTGIDDGSVIVDVRRVNRIRPGRREDTDDDVTIRQDRLLLQLHDR
jgi:hypothetical protein